MAFPFDAGELAPRLLGNGMYRQPSGSSGIVSETIFSETPPALTIATFHRDVGITLPTHMAASPRKGRLPHHRYGEVVAVEPLCVGDDDVWQSQVLCAAN